MKGIIPSIACLAILAIPGLAQASGPSGTYRIFDGVGASATDSGTTVTFTADPGPDTGSGTWEQKDGSGTVISKGFYQPPVADPDSDDTEFAEVVPGATTPPGGFVWGDIFWKSEDPNQQYPIWSERSSGARGELRR